MRMPDGIRAVGPCLALNLALAAWLAGSTPAGATTLRRMDLPELVTHADRVVHARAVGRNVHWDAAGRQILTDTTFEVLGEAKGQGPARLTVSLLGGRIDPVEMSAAGTPVFKVGDEVVLFTSPRSDGMKDLVGFSQGVMRILQDPDTGEKVAVSEIPVGVTVVEMVGGRPQEIARPARHQAPLATLLDEVKKLADQQAEGRRSPSRVRQTVVAPAPVPATPQEDRP